MIEEEFKHVSHKNFRPQGFPLIDVEFVMCDGTSWCARIKGQNRHIFWGDQKKLSMGGVWNLFGEDDFTDLSESDQMISYGGVYLQKRVYKTGFGMTPSYGGVYMIHPNASFRNVALMCLFE